MSPTFIEPPLASNLYIIRPLPSTAALALPAVQLPLTVLLAVPDPAAASLRIVNVPEMTGYWLGRFGPRAMLRIMQPRVWVPGWSDEQVATFAFQWAALGGPLDQIRVEQLPTVIPGALSAPVPPTARFDLVHFIGDVADVASPSIRLGATDLTAQQSADLLSKLGTRLLILQVNAITPAAQVFADAVVTLGGPIVLLVAGQNVGAVVAYFRGFYGNLLHNRPLGEAADPDSLSQGGLQVTLVTGQGADLVFKFDGAIAELRARLDRAQQESSIQIAQGKAIQERASRMLHTLQFEALKPQLEAYSADLDRATSIVSESRQRLAAISGVPWNHEYEGVVPLHQAAANVEAIETTVNGVGNALKLVEGRATQEEARAPRVLNVNFAHPGGGVLALREGLVEATGYDLLVDVGPRWTTIPSLVQKGGEFPEDALPPGPDGYRIDVTIISEDFVPHLASTSMWLPRGSGRSFPMIGISPAATSGPIALRLRTPDIGPEAGILTARARLCLYYENNLLQSASVHASIVKTPTVTLTEPNAVEIDFALTNSFADVQPSFAKRAIKLTPDDIVGLHPIKVNLVLNDDGDRHRFIVRRQLDGGPAATSPCSAEAWTPYDPVASIQLLEAARNRLAECFYERDGRGGIIYKKGRPVVGLDGTNAKPYRQFQWDLLQLARLGTLLFNRAFSNVQAGNTACNAVEWIQDLRLLLRDASIIQVARTESSQYVFPWSLVYDYPLIDAERGQWRMCQVLEREWSASGRRQGPAMKRCPFDDAAWHQRNIICPYGFWGLRHVIEEPPSVKQPLGRAVNGVVRGNVLNIGVATVTDPDLATGISAHLNKLRSIAGVAFNPDKEANDWSSLITMLRAPEIAYFLCHGEYDSASRTTYLRLGKGNRVSPDDLLNWAKSLPPDGPDVQLWKQRHPFVFINGCHTSALKPGEIVSFVSCFSGLEAGGVLGTEISVLFPVAAEVAEFIFGQLAGPNGPTVGEGLRSVRWQLANKGNLLGLAYTLYGLADLHVVMEGGMPAAA
jgi:hypothetical protein